MNIRWTMLTSGISSSYDKVPQRATIESVDNKMEISTCTICEKPILEGEDYRWGYEDNLWHTKCDNDQKRMGENIQEL